MPEDKIRIDWNDLNRPEVDARLEQERRMKGAAAHYGQPQGIASGSQAVPGREYGRLAPCAGAAGTTPLTQQGSGLFYSSVFYTCVAGLVMAFVGWALTENLFNQDEKANPEELVADALKEQGISPLEFALKSENEQARIVGDIQSRVMAQHLGETILWFAIIGGLVGIGLASVDGLVSRAYGSAAVAGVIGGIAGLVGGGIAGLLGQILYSALRSAQSSQTNLGLQILARTLAWGLAGMLLGLAQGMAMRSSKRIRNGLVGGLIGGLIGGLLFDPIGFALKTGATSRMLALCVIGGATGAMIGIVENLLKDAWLRVVAGPLTGKQFVIYRNPTAFGSSPKADIYLFKDPSIEPRHALLHSTPQGCVLEDAQSASGTYVNGRRVAQQRLRPNDLIQIGQYQFAYGEKARASIASGRLA